MKLAVPTKNGWGVGFFGLFLFIFGMIILILDPVQLIVKKMTKMTEGSMAHKMFERVPVDMLVKVYLFNITNSEKFLSGEDSQLEFNEIGPYVFREGRGNSNITYYDNGTVGYIPNITIEHVPELSAGNLQEDRIITINIPLLGILSTNSKAPFYKKMALNAIVASLGSQPILDLSVYDFLWGYDDKLIRLAAGYMPNWITFSKFGILDRLYSNNKDQITMDINETSSEMYSIQTWSGSAGLKQWKFTDLNSSLPCSVLKGAYEGIVFPPGFQAGTPIKFYKKNYCRVLSLDYTKEVTAENGLKAFLYELPFNQLSCKNPDNVCFCPKNGPCLPDGLFDVTPCYYGLPLAVSLPHFFGGDNTLLERFRGLNPNTENHSSYLLLQPDIGIPIKYSTKTQINLVISNIKFNTKSKGFSDMIIPVMWIDGYIEGLPSDLVMKIRLAYTYMPIAETCMGWIMIIMGLSCIMYKVIPQVLSINDKTNLKHQLTQYAPVSLIDKLEYIPNVNISNSTIK